MDTWGVSDELPDICMLNGTKAKEFAETGVILNLDDYIKEYKLTDKIYPDAFSELKYNDSIYGIPWEYANYAFILYNKGIFNEVGISEFPKTLEELIEACKKIKAAGYIPMAMGDKALWPADSLAFSAFVNNFVGNDWYNSILKMDEKASFKDAEFINALTAYQQLAKEGVFNENLSSIDNDQRGALYQNREAAMISAGNWECNSIVNIAPEVAEETYSALWPAPANGAKTHNSIVASSAWGFSLGANIDKEKIPYAMDFISNYICSQEYGKKFTEGQGMFVPWKIDYDKSKINIVTQRQQEVALADGVVGCLNWDSTLPPQVKEIYQRGLQEILMSIKTPQELSNEMQATYEELLKNK
ncbi:extracellular solute-binding protein [Parabacteroides distasonis]|nr:extracellular solute-binding protein [Parabacteroides distasonis]